MGFWNDRGLLSESHNKIIDCTFLKQIEKLDIIFLAETHIGYDRIDHKIENY